MRRILSTTAAVLTLTVTLVGCGSGSKSSSTSKKGDAASATSNASAGNCLVGAWQQSTKDAKAFESDATTTYSTPKGRIVYTFKPTGNFDVLFDEVSVVQTAGGESHAIAINGSIGGTYTLNGSTFTTATTKTNTAVTIDGAPNAPANDAFASAFEQGDKNSQGFSCSSGTLTIKDDSGTTVLTPA